MSQPPNWQRGMIRVDLDETVGFVTFDRPEKLNAMDRAFWPDLRAALVWAEEAGARCIVFRGAGTRAFCVGGDVKSFAALSTEEERRAFQIDAMATFDAIARCALPTVAAVRGLALGGGCEVAMACDMVIAADDAVFAMPEARFGLVPGYGVLRAPSVVGAQITKFMVFGGEKLDAESALRLGLVQRLSTVDGLMDDALALARKVAAVPPAAIAAGKALIDTAIDPARVAQSIEMVTALHSTPESRAAVSSFGEKA
ncbi:enoyl-CoA hydratase/isomerase family protein [Sphingosinicella sp.]|uniref:enoyl-CoA hydratase/isomerase family protein n=1 Tax=Sphingosinicella sp. TaxID=1917971 RepID=UPI0035B31DF5